MLPVWFPLLAATLQNSPTVAPTEGDMTARQAQFALQLFREIDDAPGNVVCSPFSLSRALAMARQGAELETAREMDEVLRLPADSGERFASLVKSFEAPQVGRKDARRAAYSLEFATSLWARAQSRFEPDFLRKLKDGFDTEMQTVDFAEPEKARLAINAWTNQRTHERIPEILPAGILTPDTELVLVDTIHFMGAWAEPFQVASTKTRPFERADGTSVETAMMKRTATRPYAETESAQVVEMPFESETMSLVVVLPKENVTLEDVLMKEDCASWTRALAPRLVDLSLPKFQYRFGANLKTTLEKMGMRQAFDPALADFGGITKVPLFIGAVLQQAFVSVDEKGAEAAAATAVVMMRSTSVSRPDKPVVVDADHPFLFFIRHRSTGTVLFLGRVSDPTR